MQTISSNSPAALFGHTISNALFETWATMDGADKEVSDNTGKILTC
jgi:hypothetical protein